MVRLREATLFVFSIIVGESENILSEMTVLFDFHLLNLYPDSIDTLVRLKFLENFHRVRILHNILF